MITSFSLDACVAVALASFFAASPPAAKSAPVATGTVRLTENASDASAGNLPAIKIETKAAIYYLEKSGGGLSSLIDPEGNDWIGFHSKPRSRAGGEYRGFPNAVFNQGGNYFHPKSTSTDTTTTRVEKTTDQYASILVTSDNHAWSARYEFFPTHCTFTMTKMPENRKYWVLYEGTPGGELNLDDWWMTSEVTSPQPLTQRFSKDILAPEWVAFGDKNGQRSIVVRHHEDDLHQDSFFQMKEQMVVFGFGRDHLTAYLSTLGQQFSIGLVESSDHEAISDFANRMASPSEATSTKN